MEVPTDTYNNFRAIVSYHAANTFYNNIYTTIIDDEVNLRLDNLDDRYKARAKKYIDLVVEGRHTILGNLANLHIRYIKVNYTLASYVSLFSKYISGQIVKITDESSFCARFLTKLYEKILVYIIDTGVNKITSLRQEKYFTELQKVVTNLFEETKKEINIASVSNDSKMDYIRSLEKRLEEIRNQYTGLNQRYEELLSKYNNIKNTQNHVTSSFENNTKPQPLPQFYSSTVQSEEDEYRAFVEEEARKSNNLTNNPTKMAPQPQKIIDEDTISDFYSPDI